MLRLLFRFWKKSLVKSKEFDSGMKKTIQTKVETQQAYVLKSLTRALQEVKLAKLEGRQLLSLDDFLKELDEEEQSTK